MHGSVKKKKKIKAQTRFAREMWSLVILVSPLPQQVMQTVLITEGHSKTPMSAE